MQEELERQINDIKGKNVEDEFADKMQDEQDELEEHLGREAELELNKSEEEK